MEQTTASQFTALRAAGQRTFTEAEKAAWGELLRSIRLLCNLTQSDLGDRTGRTKSEISRWEHARHTPHPRARVELAEALAAACGE